MLQLTAGSCQLLWAAEPQDADVFNSEHTVQFLSVKKVGSNAAATTPGPDRYRVVLSDGVHYMQAMLATPLNALVQDNRITRGTVATLKKVSCNYVQERKLVIILNLEIIDTIEKIGDPQALEPGTYQEPSSASSPAVRASDTSTAASTSAAPLQGAATSRQQPPPPAKQGPAGSIYPIEGLSPYQNNWTIKARVVNKSDIKTWSNQRGEGKLFNVTLLDDSGEIRGTGFNQVVDELYPKLEEGKVYYISKAHVNLAKKKFSSVADYELGFHKGTEIEECLDSGSMPKIKYNFIPLDKVGDLEKDALCDVIGIAKEIGELSSVNSVKQNRTIVKRDLTLVDASKRSMRLTLWGKHAEQFDAEPNSVIAFKNVKVGDFGGRSLSMSPSSTMEINPEIDECFNLRGWYDDEGAKETFTAYSGTSGGAGGGGVVFNRAEVKTLDEVKRASYGLPDRPDAFSARATLMHIKADNISYEACPKCNKKVENTGSNWHCVKCDLSYDAPEHRYIISMAVADQTGQAWLQGFNEVGNVLFGMTATELMRIKDDNLAQFEEVFHSVDCMTYNFSCRAKQDTFNEKSRIRYGISQIKPVDYREEAQALRDLLYSSWAR